MTKLLAVPVMMMRESRGPTFSGLDHARGSNRIWKAETVVSLS